MFTFILSIVIGWFIYEKFFRVNYDTGKDYLETLDNLKHIELPRDIAPIDLVPMHGYLYTTEQNLKYLADPADIVGVRPACGVNKYETPYGKYHVLVRNTESLRDMFYASKAGAQMSPALILGYEYIQYEPKICPICGREIEYYGPTHPYGGEVCTSIVPSSESRYCEHCRNILTRKDEELIPFFINECSLTENHRRGRKKIVTVKDYEFNHYMMACKRITIMQEELERVGYAEISGDYDYLLSMSTLTEFSKNIGAIEQWEVFRKLV